jgi:hypothetical protein
MSSFRYCSDLGCLKPSGPAHIRRLAGRVGHSLLFEGVVQKFGGHPNRFETKLGNESRHASTFERSEADFG